MLVARPDTLEASLSPHLTDDMKSCIEACVACHEACMETTARLRMQGPGDEGQIGALLDCADLCRLTASFVATRLAASCDGVRAVRGKLPARGARLRAARR